MKRKNLLFGAIIVVVMALVAALLILGIYRRVNREAIAVRIDPQRPMVALTFDDGPNARYTPQVLDILYRQQVPATFFLVGEKLEGNGLIIQEMAASGHEIGCHTDDHRDLTTLDGGEIRREVQQFEEKLLEILPDYRIRYVRPPYGRYTEGVENAVDLPLMLWTMDSGDWENPDAERIHTTVVGEAQDGETIVFHDDNGETVEALDKIISELKAKGFQFVTVSQMEKWR